MNSEATLNCNGKEFKCVNSTHYQSCSLTERVGKESQWIINGAILPCLAGQECNDVNAISCTAVEIPTVPNQTELTILNASNEMSTETNQQQPEHDDDDDEDVEDVDHDDIDDDEDGYIPSKKQIFHSKFDYINLHITQFK